MSFGSFFKSVAKGLALVNTVVIVAKNFLPPQAVAVFEMVYKIVTGISDSYPTTTLAAVASAAVVSHAVALKITTPEKWKQEPSGKM
jgi:hypothetical protein